MVVGAGDTENLTATVKPAIDATAADYPITVSATAGDYSAQAQLVVEIDRQLLLRDGLGRRAPEHQRHCGQPHHVPGHHHQHRLGGPGQRRPHRHAAHRLDARPWTRRPSPPSPVGQTANATVSITPASSAIAGDYIVTLSARADQVTTPQTIQLRTTVETSSIWGFVGIALIVLVLIGLFLVFRRYGRR